MEKYITNEIEDALQIIASTIVRCEKAQLKFKEGTSQYSLLNNRIKALYISKALLEKDDCMGKYTLGDVEKALPPVVSIISKTEKAQIKYEAGTSQYKRFMPLIKAMYISKEYIEDEILKRT